MLVVDANLKTGYKERGDFEDDISNAMAKAKKIIRKAVQSGSLHVSSESLNDTIRGQPHPLTF